VLPAVKHGLVGAAYRAHNVGEPGRRARGRLAAKFAPRAAERGCRIVLRQRFRRAKCRTVVRRNGTCRAAARLKEETKERERERVREGRKGREGGAATGASAVDGYTSTREV